MTNIIFKIGGVLVIISLCAAYYFYSQNKINTLTTNVSKYKDSSTKANAIVKSLKKNSQEQFKQFNLLNNKLKNSQKENDRLNKLFGDHNFSNLAYKKPGLIEKRINDGTEKVFNDIVKLTSTK